MDLLELRSDQRLAESKNTKQGEMFVFASRQIKCTRCGIVPKRPETSFYKKTDGSSVFAGQNNRICVCKDCANKIFEEYCEESDLMNGLIRFCCTFNYYYDKDMAQAMFDNCNFSIGSYIASVNRSFKGLSFVDSLDNIVSVPHPQTTSEDKQQIPKSFDRTISWTIEDRKNKDNVVALVGYDPFASSGNYTDEQLKFLYNTSAGYITDSVEQDPHKLQNVILMVKTFLQIDTLDKLMTAEMNAHNPDIGLMTSYANMKEKLTSTATRIANENGFSEKTSSKSTQGVNTLSNKMKEMFDANFTLSKVNIHDVNMSESFREIAQMNAKALIDEMGMTGDDYARLCAEQRTFLSELQKQNDDLEETNRLLSIKIKDLETKMSK